MFVGDATTENDGVDSERGRLVPLLYGAAVLAMALVATAIDTLKRPSASPRGRAALDLLILAATGTAFCLNVAADLPRRHFVVIVVGVWGGYALGHEYHDPGAMRRWGFRPTTAEATATRRQAAAVAVLASTGILAWAGSVAALRATLAGADFWQLLLVCPLWGMAQQWLVLGVGARAVEVLLSSPDRGTAVNPRNARMATTATVGALFGLLHAAALAPGAWAPDVWALAIACAVIGGAWVHIFLSNAALGPLGVVHGLLTTLFHFLVLRTNPLFEL